MKKALTIWVDDDCDLKNFCATFVVWEDKQSSVTMMNETVPESAKGFYLPWKTSDGKTVWIDKDSPID